MPPRDRGCVCPGSGQAANHIASCCTTGAGRRRRDAWWLYCLPPLRGSCGLHLELAPGASVQGGGGVSSRAAQTMEGGRPSHHSLAATTEPVGPVSVGQPDQRHHGERGRGRTWTSENGRGQVRTSRSQADRARTRQRQPLVGWVVQYSIWPGEHAGSGHVQQAQRNSQLVGGSASGHAALDPMPQCLLGIYPASQAKSLTARPSLLPFSSLLPCY